MMWSRGQRLPIPTTYWVQILTYARLAIQTKICHGLFSTLQVNNGIVPQGMSEPLPSTCFQVHYLLITLSLNAVNYELLIAILYILHWLFSQERVQLPEQADITVPEFYPLLLDNLLQLLRMEVKTTEQFLCFLVPIYHVLCFLLSTDMWVYFNRPVQSAKCSVLFLVASRQLAALAEDTCNRIQTPHTVRL